MIHSADDLVSLYQLGYALFLPDFQRRLLGGGEPLIDGVPGPLRAELEHLVAGRRPLGALSALEQRCFLGERLLRDSDAASMAVSLELRLPLVDHVLTEVVDRLPENLRYRPVGTKSLLRRIGLAGLEPALFDRPKQGFVLPIEKWLRTAVQADVEATLHDAASCARVGLDPATVRALWDAFRSGAPGLYWTRVWALYMLIRWADEQDVYV
jgi:asparagine synthase (glutamine-hydrolysing)